LKIATTSGIAIFNSNQAKLSNIKILGCGFDGSINYPADSKTAPSSVAHNIGIYFHSDETPSGQTAHDYQNIEVSDNYFYKLTWGSVYFKGLNMANLQITDNWAKYGSYGWDVYSVFNQGALHPPTGYDYASTGVIIARNHTTLNGPQLLWDPTNSGYASSTDGIQVRGSKQAVVANNTVSYTGGEGIRIEVDNGSTVTGNVVSETGGDGIIVYNQSKGTVITGNTVKNWGRTPLASSIRNYGGTYVVAREFPYATGPKLPSNPLTTNWFSKWPYSTASSQMQTSKIQRYSTTDYYNPATGAGILPFRGFAGIGIYSGSYNVTVTGNQTIPNLSKDSTGYLYASDFGLSCVHPVNGPVGGTCAGGTISGNTFAGRVYPIYHPAYMDPINRHGAVGR
jgi:parallel beta-helix repeat protein